MIARNKLFWFIADDRGRSAIVGDRRKLMFSCIASIARSSSAMIAGGLRYMRTRLNPISAGEGGWNPLPSRFFPRYRHKNQPIDSKLSDFYLLLSRHNLTKNQVHNLSGGHMITLCRKHFVSPHIFHCIFTEFSCSTFSFFLTFIHLYLVLTL